MPTNTYVALDTQTLTSNVSSVTFSNINQGYTDLILISSARVTGAVDNDDILVTLSGDTGSNYSATYMVGNGTNAISGRNSGTSKGYWIYAVGANVSSNIYTLDIMNFNNYSNTTTFKTMVSKTANSNNGPAARACLWRSTSAITSISLNCPNSNIAAGSTFSLYGIAAEGTSPAPKATGGAIYQDSTYYYHVFGATGTFTPLSSLTVDYAIVGGGAGARFGGGGAGGFRAFTGATLSATGYTATIGAGGTSAASGTATSFNSNSVSGGGYGSTGASNGISGGSGGGAGSVSLDPSATGGAGNAGSYSPVEGYAGGNAVSTGSGTSGANAGGGGGAGGVGGNGTNSGGTSGGTGGAGGAGSFTYNSINISSWLTATGVGVNGYVAAGGAGGGAGAGVGANGVANSGNGAQGNNWGNSGTGVNGGSGVVIVRYVK